MTPRGEAPDERLAYIPTLVGTGQVAYIGPPNSAPPGLWIKGQWRSCPAPERPWGIAAYRQEPR